MNRRNALAEIVATKGVAEPRVPLLEVRIMPRAAGDQHPAAA
jgi:hypothetical protein